MYEIIDNFISKEEHQLIHDTMIGDDGYFPWFYNNYVVAVSDRIKKNNFQFTHTFYTNYTITSNYFNLLLPIINKLNIKAIERIKANLNPNTKNKIMYDWHTDVDSDEKKSKTAIYYINTNNGVTILSDKTEINSVANRLLIFNQNVLHTGTTCTDQKIRSLINFNFIQR